MSEFSRVRLYIFILTALAFGAVLLSAATLANQVNDWVIVFVIALAIAFFDAFSIDILLERIEITISEIVKFASILIFPAPITILAIALGTLLGEIRIERRWYKKLFNISAITVTWVVVASVYHTLHQPQIDYFGSAQNVLAWVVAGMTEFVINSALVSLVIALASRQPFVNFWSRNIRQVVWPSLSMLSLGAFLAILWNYNPLSILLLALPVVGLRHSYKLADYLERQTKQALVALMQVIDERDEHTYDHSRRVSDYARAIAGEFDLSEDAVETIASAALLHDLGKVGMADGILFGAKLLSPDERKSAERHAEIGATLLSKFPLFQKGTLLVRHHHERFDGKGYPDALKGETIPLGARIISVCDSYQAMTEKRPYRHALSQEVAIEQLRQGSGSQFDPEVVRIFIGILAADAAKETSAPTANPITAES